MESADMSDELDTINRKKISIISRQCFSDTNYRGILPILRTESSPLGSVGTEVIIACDKIV